jgi:NAD(P)-dependent dehydrogenase (short-subunit alcohol dehydrogenase family)
MISLNDKVIIVTGGSGLLGTDIIYQIKKLGAIVINLEINIKTNVELTEIECDITNPESINNTISLIIQKFGKIDGLVNNAYPRTNDWGNKFEDIKIDSWKSNIDMQLNSTFYLCQIVLEKMKIQKFGSIINMASIYGLVGPDFSVYANTDMTMPAAYSAIKGGVISFTRYLSSYYGKYNIRINCISPGGIFNNQPDTFVKNYEKKVPMNRMGKPSDISPAVCFMLSDESSYITGHNLVIDGGWVTI